MSEKCSKLILSRTNCGRNFFFSFKIPKGHAKIYGHVYSIFWKSAEFVLSLFLKLFYALWILSPHLFNCKEWSSYLDLVRVRIQISGYVEKSIFHENFTKSRRSEFLLNETTRMNFDDLMTNLYFRRPRRNCIKLFSCQNRIFVVRLRFRSIPVEFLAKLHAFFSWRLTPR